MASARATLQTVISADATKFHASMRRVSASAASAGKAIGGAMGGAGKQLAQIGSAAAQAATRAVALGSAMAAAAASAALFRGVKLASDIEQMGISFEVMTGSAEKGKRILEEIRKFGEQTPYEFPALAKGVQTMIAFGIEADEAVANIKMLADVASGDAQKLESLALVFAQISSTGRLTGGDLLQLINQGFNPLQEIANKTGESMASLKKRMEDGEISFEQVKQTFIEATSEGGKFFGMTERQSKTFSGRMSTLADGVNAALTRMGMPLIETFIPYIEKATAVIESMVPWFEKAGEEMGAMLESFIENANLENIIRIFTDLTPVIIATIGEAVAKAIEIAHALFKSLFSEEGLKFIKDTLLDLFVAVFNEIGEAAWEFGKTLKKAIKGEVTFKDDTRIIGTPKEQEDEATDFAGRLADELGKIDFGPGENLKAALDGYKDSLADMFPKVAKPAGGSGLSEADAYERELEEQRRRVAEDAARMANPYTNTTDATTFGPPRPPSAEMGPSKSLMNKAPISAAARAASARAAGFSGLGDLYGMQAARASGIAPGADNVFARDRARLGIASGLQTGGLGAKRRIGQDKSEKKRETLEEKQVSHLEAIENKIGQALTVG